MSEYFIARQPIFDQHVNVYAYELLFRTSNTNAVPDDLDDDVATAQVLATSDNIGLNALVGDHLAFINLPAKFLLEPGLLPLAPDGVVLEVLETVELTDAVIEGMRILSERGYRIALDDIVNTEDADRVLPYLSLVKLDLPLIPRESWGPLIAQLKERGVKVLAEKVETEDDFRHLAELGCDYFQGYFFARPKIVSGRRLPPNKLALLQLMAKINQADIDVEELSELVTQDVALSVRAMNYANSPANALNRQIKSVREAVVYVGRENIRRWVTLFAMAKMDDKPGELITMALVRAKFMELMANEFKADDIDAYFTVGLFSMLDVLMDSAIEQVLETLLLPLEIHRAIASREGQKGQVLRVAIALERGDFEALSNDSASAERAADLHLAATRWADTTIAEMSLS